MKPMTDDLIIQNARIHTMDPEYPIADSLAVRDGKIAAVGKFKDVAGLSGQGTFVLDAKGWTIMPGLIDAHTHFASHSFRQIEVDLDGIPTLEEALEKVRVHAQKLAPGSWVRGGGFNKNVWGKGDFPTRHDLDRVVADRPVFLRSKCGHSMWCNTRALELAGVERDTVCPPGGGMERDESGFPTGIFKETAQALIWRVVPEPEPAEYDRAILAGIASSNALGLTGIHTMEGPPTLGALQRLGSRDMRFTATIPHKLLDTAIELGIRSGFGNEWLRVGQLKMFADGALGVQTARMFEPYENNPGSYGISTITVDELREDVARAARAGIAVAIHAIGDRANREVLDALEAVKDEAAKRGLRQRIEHAQLLTPQDLPRFAELNVIASMQPFHAVSDRWIADRHWGTRARWAYAFKSLWDHRAVLAFGSDAPVENIDPIKGIAAAVTRQHPDDRESPPWYPEERITVYQAVWGYTMGAALASGEEHLKGSLTPGKFADLVVMDQDIFAVDPARLTATKILGTMVGGRWVYRHAAFDTGA